MDTFFHHPHELKTEVSSPGFRDAEVFGIEGPGWLLRDFDEWWDDEPRRGRLLRFARTLETEPSLIGVSAHLMAVGRK